MPHTMTAPEQAREKRNAALSSLMAALMLTGLKLVVGLSTNSLGILSEAAHSGFDLLAAGVTLFAVRYAAFPADPGHPYGHGKIENLSALVEALLLLITCGWIVWEAVDRLFFSPAVVQASFWALGVMVLSIVVDVSRSRMLMRIAKKHRSQALEADALHFSTDIWSSAVVILGLVALYIASLLPEGSALRPWLERADAIAALGVSVIIVYVSLALARQAVNVLLDAGDAALAEKISVAVRGLAGIRGIQRLRLRHSGPSVFLDMAAVVGNRLTLEQTEQLRREVATLVHSVEPHIDMTLEVLPDEGENVNTIARVRSLAAAHGLDIHAIEFLDLDAEDEGSCRGLLQLHVERDPAESLETAHSVVNDFEKRLRQEFPYVTIVSHIEPLGDSLEKERLVEGRDLLQVQQAIEDVLRAEEDACDAHNIVVRSYGEGQGVSFHCRLPSHSSVQQAHDIASRIQAALHQRLPELRRVVVHTEPLKKEKAPPSGT